MKIGKRISLQAGKQKGATIVVVAILMTVLIGLAAFAIDIGHVMATKNELQNVADAAALAATGQLGGIYEPMTPVEQTNYVCDQAGLLVVADDVAQKNSAGGKGIAIDGADLQAGTWDGVNRTLTVTNNQPDAVHIVARRDAVANGPLTTLFAKVFGINSVPVTAQATAALTGLSQVVEGELKFPAGISRRWFARPEFCNQPIVFYPTQNDCTGTDFTGLAGWHTETDAHANANKIRDILNGIMNGTHTSVEATAGLTQFWFTGGTVAAAFEDLQALFDYMKTRDADGNDATWTTKVVVYDSDCGNPGGAVTVDGFATVVIDQVLTTPEKTIIGRVICEKVDPGRGGGSYYGTKGSIPNLVQ